MKRTFLGFVVGFVVIALLGFGQIGLNIILIRSISPETWGQYSVFSKSLGGGLAQLAPLIGGFIAGYIAREKGLKLGVMLGVSFSLITVVLMLLFAISDPATFSPESTQALFGLIFSGIVSAVAGAIQCGAGGYIGEQYYRFRKNPLN